MAGIKVVADVVGVAMVVAMAMVFGEVVEGESVVNVKAFKLKTFFKWQK